MVPKFSAYPFDRMPRVVDPAAESAVACWLAARPDGERLAKLVGGPVRAAIVRAGHTPATDPYAGACQISIAGAVIDVRGSGAAVRRLAQRVLGGPDELAAPRPLGAVEHAVWALAVATALDDLGVAGEVWPRVDPPPPASGFAVELAVELDGTPMAVVAIVPRELAVRAPRPRPLPRWADRARVDATVVVGRCALPAAGLAGLAVRDVITVERTCELELLGGTLELAAEPAAVVATVTTGYVRRSMALPDDAQVELTVALGTTQLTLRQVMELAVGQVVALGRPLGGPFELRALDRTIGRGELVDVDGELGVRIVSLEE
jgi:flagellar motor switch/type III secretory pathway protein FliN